MGKVDFYILSGEGADEPLRVTCRVAEKAWRLGNRVRVQVAGADSLRRLDDLMWTFKQESFLPHEIDGQNPECGSMDPAPVVLGTDTAYAGAPDVLINLTGTLPDNAGEISRIAEIIPADEDSKRAGRKRYQHYRDQGFKLDIHEV